jgi:threonyl-tRNA synthetase
MEYVDSDGLKKYPFIIHRTSIGCYERTLALLIEKYAGAMPTWLAPEQVRILPVAQVHNDYAYEIQSEFKKLNIRVGVDDSEEKLGKKIRLTQLDKIPYMLVVGDNEVESRTVSARSRKENDLGVMAVSDFIAKITAEINEKIN